MVWKPACSSWASDIKASRIAYAINIWTGIQYVPWIVELNVCTMRRTLVVLRSSSNQLLEKNMEDPIVQLRNRRENLRCLDRDVVHPLN